MKQYFYFVVIFCLLILSCSQDSDTLGETNQSTLSGSYANMLTVGTSLYVVSDNELITYSLLNPETPTEVSRLDLGFGIESLFYRNGILFIGSRESLFVYTIDEFGIPQRQSQTDYNTFGFQACDPVVANDSIAFVTLSTRINDGGCGFSNINELRLYNIKDLTQPILINVTEMEEPKGLGLDDKHLFVCEANNGVKVFDVSIPSNPVQINHVADFVAKDIILSNGLMMVVGGGFLHEFDYSDVNNIQLLSVINLK